MSVELEEFKFPDETTVNMTAEPDFKVEVVDDTPPADRGRHPLPKEIVNELEGDDLEEYSEKVKTRISQMKKVWHDERREKERASREREEALMFAQKIHQENQALKQRLSTGEKIFASEITKSAEFEALSAEEKLKQAYESGDAEKLTTAQKLFTEATFKLREAKQFRPSLQEQDFPVQQDPQVQPARAQPDVKAEAWLQKNSWFGANEEMTSLALGLHERLVRSGVDPRSNDYYQTIDKSMRKRFPEEFSEEPSPRTEERAEPISRRSNSVVAPATRSTAPRQIRLTASQAAIAKRLGISPEAYAREIIKLENNNG
jgi:hypothetical protein